MKTQISRRSFLKKSAIAVGAVAVFNVDGVAGADQVGGFKTLPGELKEKTMPHVIVRENDESVSNCHEKKRVKKN